MNEIKIVQTDLAPQAIGPYSQAVQMGSLVYTSGQIPLTKDGVLLEGDMKEQARQVMENTKAVLGAAGCSLDDVLKTTVFITDMNEFEQLNEIYSLYFGQNKPARSCVEVSRLPKNVKVEMECIASLK